MADTTGSTIPFDDVWASLSRSIVWKTGKPKKNDLSKFVVSLPLSYVVDKCYRYSPLVTLSECFAEQGQMKKKVPFPFQVLFSLMAMTTNT